MEGSSEYVVIERPGATFQALRDVVGERKLPIVEDDPRHLRLAFRLDRPETGEQIKALCAILDIGLGLSKLVVVCVDEADGSVVAPDDSLASLFMQVEHTLHTSRAAGLARPVDGLAAAAPPGSNVQQDVGAFGPA